MSPHEIAHIRLGIVGSTVYLHGKPWRIKQFLLNDQVLIHRGSGWSYETSMVKASELFSESEGRR